MKIITKNFAVLFISLFLSTTFFSLKAANAANIAVIDIEDVLKNSDAMKDAQKKISKKQENFQKEIDTKQEALEKESKKILAKKGSLSEEGFAKEQEKFSKKVDDLKTLVNSRQDTLKKASLDVINNINSSIKAIVGDIKEEKKLDVIISASSTINYNEELNISDEVLKRLNKKISKVEIK
jgi:Skp family chaperone for outer membrane proteins